MNCNAAKFHFRLNKKNHSRCANWAGSIFSCPVLIAAVKLNTNIISAQIRFSLYDKKVKVVAGRLPKLLMLPAHSVSTVQIFYFSSRCTHPFSVQLDEQFSRSYEFLWTCCCPSILVLRITFFLFVSWWYPTVYIQSPCPLVLSPPSRQGVADARGLVPALRGSGARAATGCAPCWGRTWCGRASHHGEPTADTYYKRDINSYKCLIKWWQVRTKKCEQIQGEAAITRVQV